MTKTSAYLLCTAPHSGSPLLCDMLRDTGIAGWPEAYFEAETVAGWGEAHGVAPISDPPSPGQIERILTMIRQKGRGGSDLFGARLRGTNLLALRKALVEVVPGQMGDAQRIDAMFGPTRYVHLTRMDKVQQAVSYLRKRQSKPRKHRHLSAAAAVDLQGDVASTVYDAEALRAAVTAFEAYDTAWVSWFAANRVRPLRITYEALAGNPVRVLRDVLEYLGLDQRLAEAVDPVLAAASDPEGDEWASRFRAQG